MFSNDKKGFTFIELLIVIGIIAVLTGAVIITLNPGGRFAAIRNTARDSHIKSLYTSLDYYRMTNRGSWGDIDLPSELTEICNTNLENPDCEGLVDLSSLVPTYIDRIPVDPKVGTGEDGTGYKIRKSPTTGDLCVEVLHAEKDKDIFLGACSWRVSSPADLQNIGYGHEDGDNWGTGEDDEGNPTDKYDDWQMDDSYVLTNDIDWSEHYNDYFTPIGGSWWSLPAFEGDLDGAGHEIQNINIGHETETWYIALFSVLDNGGTIKNLGMTGEVNGEGSAIGSFVGGMYGGTIDNSYMIGTVNGETRTGGLVGDLHSFNGDATINNSYMIGAVTGDGGDRDVGGIVGQMQGGSIVNSYAAADVSGEDNVGGLAGYTDGHIINSYAMGDVDGDDSVGGFVGLAWDASIENSYSIGEPVGESNIGGFCGRKEGDTDDIDNFWDTEASETTQSEMGTGKTTAEMQDIDTYTTNNVDWDMVEEGNHDGNEDTAIWFIDNLQDYPKLWFQFNE